MRKLLTAIVILMAFPAVASAGGGGVDTSGCAGFSEGNTVAMLDSCFSGTTHFAPDGATITVGNDGVLPHTLTAVDGSFDTGNVDPGDSALLTIDEPGVYRVFCALHGTAQGDGMAGVLVVGDAGPATVSAGSEAPRQVDVLAAGETATASAQPEVVTVEGDVDAVQLVVLLMVGLAVGLGLASLLTVLRLRVAERPNQV